MFVLITSNCSIEHYLGSRIICGAFSPALPAAEMEFVAGACETARAGGAGGQRDPVTAVGHQRGATELAPLQNHHLTRNKFE